MFYDQVPKSFDKRFGFNGLIAGNVKIGQTDLSSFLQRWLAYIIYLIG